ncbi:MAG: hypothetical protein ACRBBN_16880 [Methyloligellaceae bacterium]
MKVSILPLLLLAQLALIWLAASRLKKQEVLDRSDGQIINTGLLLLGLWGIAIWMIASSGVTQSDWFLASWPPFWFLAVTILIVELPMVAFKKVKQAVYQLISSTPLYWLTAIHIFRVLAIGSIIKSLNGEFSFYFGLIVGVPDFIFGLSAILVTYLVYTKQVGDKFVAIWNYAGALIIMPTAIILMQLGLPGPVQIFTATPTIATIFEFPMVLAPAVIVPLFVMANLFTARYLRTK